MSVNNNSNKELLYELLQSVITENNFNVNVQTLVSLIDSQCDEYEMKKQNFNGLSEINKIILDNCYKFFLENQLNYVSNLSEVNDNDLFKKKDTFNDKFNMVKNNFDSMIKLKKPDEIKFQDEEEPDMPPENLETIMNQTLADREKELNMITQKYSNENKKQAENWINKNKSPEEIKKNNENININIVEPPKKNKKVSFEIPMETFDVFNKLKKKVPQNKSTNKQLNKEIIDKSETIIENQKLILKNQNIILDLLRKLNINESNINESNINESNNDETDNITNNLSDNDEKD